MKPLHALVIVSALIATAAGTQTASAVTTIDLVNANTGTANGVIYSYTPEGSLGTAVIDPFLRLGTSTPGAEQG